MNIKSMEDIKNGWLVITRNKGKYIKIDDVLVGESGRYVRVERYETGLKFIYERFEWCKDFDIVEIWKPKHKAASLSFDLDDRKIVWGESKRYNVIVSEEDVNCVVPNALYDLYLNKSDEGNVYLWEDGEKTHFDKTIFTKEEAERNIDILVEKFRRSLKLREIKGE